MLDHVGVEVSDFEASKKFFETTLEPLGIRPLMEIFHTAALAAGARDKEAPGPRPQYHQGCYKAFVLDLDGNNIEAVCDYPPAAS